MDVFISRIVDNNMYAAIQEIAALHCVPLAMTYKGVIASRLPLLSLRGGEADEAISEIAVLNSR